MLKSLGLILLANYAKGVVEAAKKFDLNNEDILIDVLQGVFELKEMSKFESFCIIERCMLPPFT